MIACKLTAMVPDRILSLALLNVTGGGFECFPKVYILLVLTAEQASFISELQNMDDNFLCNSYSFFLLWKLFFWSKLYFLHISLKQLNIFVSESPCIIYLWCWNLEESIWKTWLEIDSAHIFPFYGLWWILFIHFHQTCSNLRWRTCHCSLEFIWWIYIPLEDVVLDFATPELQCTLTPHHLEC